MNFESYLATNTFEKAIFTSFVKPTTQFYLEYNIFNMFYSYVCSFVIIYGKIIVNHVRMFCAF